MNDTKPPIEKTEFETERGKPIVIYCHERSNATININSVCHHCPEWLDLDAVPQIVREIKT
ncbi:MAG: hypothetical protein EOL92_00395 [Bacteroidia bacterium]|nr:hypothetical protein [Bacteroidia bacterium]